MHIITKFQAPISLLVLASFIASCIAPQGREYADPELVISGDFYVEKRPARLHLRNGSILEYYDGFRVESDTIRTMGFCFADSTVITDLPLESVKKIEYLDRQLNYSTLLPLIPIFIGVIIFILISANPPGNIYDGL